MPRLNNVLVALAAASSAVVVAVSAHGTAGTATTKHASKVKRQDCYSGYAETPLFQKKYSYVRKQTRSGIDFGRSKLMPVWFLILLRSPMRSHTK